MVVEYLITIKNSNYKKVKKESTKVRNIVCKVSFSQKIIQLHISCKAFIRSIV